MKKIVLGLLVLVFAAPSFATIYTINSGYFGAKTIEYGDTLIMTGGGGYSLRGEDYSILYIKNTSSPVVVGYSGIGSLVMTNHGQLYFSGGDVYQLDMRNYATAILNGGNIDELRGFYTSADVSHITIVCDTYQLAYTGSLVTNISGTWRNGSEFDIDLKNQSGYTSVFSNITIVPEPATMLLLGAGGLLLRRKRS
jgi:hypothetical protein